MGMTRSHPIQLGPNSSTPAVPEFSMPPSSGPPGVANELVAMTKDSDVANSSKFKLVLSKGGTDDPARAGTAPNGLIASPLPHPPSPSAPASSTASPDPDIKTVPNSPTTPAATRDASLANATTIASKPTVEAAMNVDVETDGGGAYSDTVVVKSKKSKSGKGKKSKKSSKRSSKGSTIVVEPPLPRPEEQRTTGGVDPVSETTPATHAAVEGGGAGSTGVETPPPGPPATVLPKPTIQSTTMVRTASLNRVCHHHRGITKGEVRMSCTNQPECKTIWCKRCIEKHYLDLTPSNAFADGLMILCPVCRNCCKCSSCKRKRKDGPRNARRISNLAMSSNPVAPQAISSEVSNVGVVPAVEGRGAEEEEGRQFVVKMEEDRVEDSKPIVPPTNSWTSPAFAVDHQAVEGATLSSDSVQPQQQQQLQQPTPSGILKIRVKPPKRPRNDRGSFVNHEGGMAHEHLPLTATTTLARQSRQSSRRDSTTTARSSPASGVFVATPGSMYQSQPHHQNSPTPYPTYVPYGGGSSFFGRPPSLLGGGGIAAAAGGGGPRPKRTKKVSSHYDDFAVEGVPNFEGEGLVAGGGGGGGPHHSKFEGATAEMGTPGSGVGGRETRSGTGRWGGYRKGAGGKRKVVEPAAPQQQDPHHFLGLSQSTLVGFPFARPQDRDGEPRRRPRLSGLSSASSCSELFDDDDDAFDDEDDDFESRYWAMRDEMVATTENDQRVRHWLLVPPTEPQPVLAGLESNLSAGRGDEVGYSPTSASELGGALGSDGHGKKRKEKVKWIEGPERRRRRALALQKMRDEEDAKMKGMTRGVVKEDDEVHDEMKRSLKRSLSWDASGETSAKAKELYNHCSPIKPFGDGSASATSPTSHKPLPLPVRPSSAPLLSSTQTDGESTVASPAPLAPRGPAHSDQPPPYESHFPPSIDAPLHPSRSQPPAIVVSPATTVAHTPPSAPSPAPMSPSLPAHSIRQAAPSSANAISEADADLAARSADDKRLGLRLLDAIRTITGTKLAMEAMGISPAALPIPSSSSSATAPPAMSTPSAPAPAPAPVPAVISSSSGNDHPPLAPRSTNSPVKSESDQAFTLLISQENAEYEAMRREERQRLLSTALDPQKVFRAEAQGNDVSLLDRAAEWTVGGSMDVDSDESDRRSRSGGDVGTSTTSTTTTTATTTFDFDTLLVSNGPGGGDATASTTGTGWRLPTSNAPQASLSSPQAFAYRSLCGGESIRPPPPRDGTTSLFTPQTPSKPIHPAHHYLAAPVAFGSTADDPTIGWTSGSNATIGGAATPTRGLVMEMDLDFDAAIRGGSWVTTALDE